MIKSALSKLDAVLDEGLEPIRNFMHDLGDEYILVGCGTLGFWIIGIIIIFVISDRLTDVFRDRYKKRTGKTPDNDFYERRNKVETIGFIVWIVICLVAVASCVYLQDSGFKGYAVSYGIIAMVVLSSFIMSKVLSGGRE